MNYAKKLRGFFSFLMAVVMMIGMTPIANAAETEVVKYTIEVFENAYGTVTVDQNEAEEGTVVTVVPVAKEGYTLTQVGYCTVDSEGKTGKLVEVTADENGAYTFKMPASNVKVGAAFQDGVTMTGNRIGGTKETDYTLYMANGEAFVNVGDTSVSAFVTIDKRFFDIEDVTMRLEIRQYNTEGYTVVGSKEYDYSALQTLAGKADSKNDTTYTFESIEIPVAEGKTLNEGWAEYCVVQFSRPCWTNAIGAPSYRWAYTGDATILGESVKAPSPIVWLYNLDENSHRGALIRSILKELDIPAGTVNNENLNQNIGYLVEWEGYEPVKNPYSDENYDVEYILMGNLTEVQLDDFIDAMQENNIRVNLKSVPTTWTASKTFAELFDIMAEEDEVLKAAVALDQMIYTAEELDEATYGNSEYWEEFQKVLAEAIVALSTDAEESELGANLYLNARDALLEVYLKVTGKQTLSGELELICEKQEDGTYKVSAKLNSDLVNPTFSYSWKPGGSTEDSITLTADQLYKVNLEITGTGNFYGEMSAKLSVPGTPNYEVSASANSISVNLKEYEKVMNIPDVLGYVVELYLNGEKIHSQEKAAAHTIVFDGLETETEYVVKVNAYNAVGRSDIVEKTVKTLSASAGVIPPTEGETTTPGETIPPVEEDTTVEEDTAVEEDTTTSTEDEEVSEDEKGTDSDVKTGDNAPIALWVMLLVASALAGGYTVMKNRRREDA